MFRISGIVELEVKLKMAGFQGIVCGSVQRTYCNIGTKNFANFVPRKYACNTNFSKLKLIKAIATKTTMVTKKFLPTLR